MRIIIFNFIRRTTVRVFKKFLVIIFVLVQGQVLPSDDPSSILSLWNKKTVEGYCNILPNIRTGNQPENPSFPLLNNQQALNNYLENFKKFEIFQYDNVIQLLDLSAHHFKSTYIDAGIDKNSIIFDNDKNKLQKDFPELAFYQKENEKVLSFGDNHGGFMTIAKFMIAETKDDLTIKDPSKKYITLGDIVDRGPASLPSLLFFLILHLKSPNNFLLVRGNHEVGSTFRRYGLCNEIEILFSSEQKNNIEEKIKNLCRLLPVTIYALKNNKKVSMYMHGCVDKEDDDEQIKNLLTQCKDETISARVYSSAKGEGDNVKLWGDSIRSKENMPYGNIAYDGRGLPAVRDEEITTFTSKIGKEYHIESINCAHQHVGRYALLSPYFLPNQFHFNYDVDQTKILRHGLCPCCANAQPNNNKFPGFIGYSTVVHHGDGTTAVVRFANNGIQGDEGINNFVENYLHHLKKHLKETDIFTNPAKKDIFSYLFTAFEVLYKKSIKEASDDEQRAFLRHYSDAKKQYIAFKFENGKTNRYIPSLDWALLVDIDDPNILYELDKCDTDIPISSIENKSDEIIVIKKEGGKIKIFLSDNKEKPTNSSKKMLWMGGACVALLLAYLILNKTHPHMVSWQYWKNYWDNVNNKFV